MSNVIDAMQAVPGKLYFIHESTFMGGLDNTYALCVSNGIAGPMGYFYKKFLTVKGTFDLFYSTVEEIK